MKSFLLILFSFFISLPASAQTYSISGKVSGENGEPLAGVNIVVAGTDYGTSTGLNGKYKISNLEEGFYTINFSIIGYKPVSKSNIDLQNGSVVINIIMEEKTIYTEQVVVTAGKHEQDIIDLPVSAEIIKSDFLDEKNFTNFEDALRYVPGVNMTDDQISIRGSSGYSRGAGSRVLLAIDGIPFYTGDTGETIWQIIPLASVDRVEIIKGAASSLYGSTAIGGVINVITKEISAQPVTQLSSQFGVYDEPAHEQWKWSDALRTYNRQTISHSNKINNFGFALSLTRLEDMSYKQSGFAHKYIGFLKMKYDFSPSESISILANTLNKRGGNFIYWKDSRNALVPPDADQGQRVDSDRYMFGATFNKKTSENFSYLVKAGYYRNFWEDTGESGNYSTSHMYRTEIQTNYNFNDASFIISGAEITSSKVNSNIFGNPGALGFGVYSHIDYSFSQPLSITGGIRYDYNKLDTLEVSHAVSPKIGFNYKLSENIILRSSFGTGFRAPSLAEAFTSTSASGITVKPNPNIKPETNFTFESGIYWQPVQTTSFNLALFFNEYYDFIEAGIDPNDGLVIFDNLTRARIQGFELNNNYFLFDDNLTLSLNYTYMWARDVDKNEPLKYRPRNIFYANVDYKFLDFNFGIDFRYLSRIEKIDRELIILGLVPDGDERVATYVVDLRAAYNFFISDLPLKIYFNVNNLLNYNYVELIGNLAPIRNYSLSTEIFF